MQILVYATNCLLQKDVIKSYDRRTTLRHTASHGHPLLQRLFQLAGAHCVAGTVCEDTVWVDCLHGAILLREAMVLGRRHVLEDNFIVGPYVERRVSLEFMQHRNLGYSLQLKVTSITVPRTSYLPCRHCVLRHTLQASSHTMVVARTWNLAPNSRSMG